MVELLCSFHSSTAEQNKLINDSAMEDDVDCEYDIEDDEGITS